MNIYPARSTDSINSLPRTGQLLSSIQPSLILDSALIDSYSLGHRPNIMQSVTISRPCQFCYEIVFVSILYINCKSEQSLKLLFLTLTRGFLESLVYYSWIPMDKYHQPHDIYRLYIQLPSLGFAEISLPILNNYAQYLNPFLRHGPFNMSQSPMISPISSCAASVKITSSSASGGGG